MIFNRFTLPIRRFGCLIAALAACCAGAGAYDFSAPSLGQEPIDLYYTVNPDGQTVTLTYGPETYASNSAVEIPATVTNGEAQYTVSIIGYQAFRYADVPQVLMPGTIEEVQGQAFEHSTVSKVRFSENLKHIREYAFSTTQIDSLVLHEGLQTIGERAFYMSSPTPNQNRLVYAHIPNSVSEIGAWAFAQRANLREVHLPEGLETIKDQTFSGCGKLESIVLPAGLRKIEDRAFSGAGLTGISFPAQLEEIGPRAFQGCTALTEVVLPDNIRRMDSGVFGGCTALKSIAFSAGLKEIPDDACQSCTQLTEVSMPEGVEHIGANAFSGCSRLSSIRFPESVRSTGARVVSGTALTSFTFPAALDTLATGFFAECKSLAEISVPSTVKCLGYMTFDGCSGLTRVTLPEGISTIPANLFNGCTNLAEVNIPESVVSIEGSYAFGNCAALKSLQMPSGLQKVGNYAFSGSGLEELTFPSTLEDLGQGCFSSCASLRAVHINRGIPPTVNGLAVAPDIIEDGNECTLYVPLGSKAAYEALGAYAAFDSIVEEDVPGDVYYSVRIGRTSGKGQVQIGENEPYYEAEERLVRGSAVRIALLPDEGYETDRLVCNGKDVTAELEGGVYTVESLEENLTLEAYFRESPVQLSLKSGNGGSISLPVEKGAAFSCRIVAEEGWKLNSVRLDGRDVTADVGADGAYTTPALRANSVLSVSFEMGTGVDEGAQADENGVAVYTTGRGVLTIEGAAAGETIRIYDTAGTQLRSLTASGRGAESLTLPENRTYLVQTARKTLKIAL